MEICKCGARLRSHMVKEGKKVICSGCDREDILRHYVDKQRPPC